MASVGTGLREELVHALPGVPLEVREEKGEDVVETTREGLLPVMLYLKTREENPLDFLEDIAVVDWFPREPRFQVSYQVSSLSSGSSVRVVVRVPSEDPRVPSLTQLWPGANWLEREQYDFFGVVFEGHPDLRRIIMPEDWEGHPQRKDYPLGGVRVEFRSGLVPPPDARRREA